MIWLATDFGLAGPYVGQVKASIARLALGLPVIDLFSDLPAFSPKPAAYLLAAYASALAEGDVLLAVVDPGVGSDRRPLMMPRRPGAGMSVPTTGFSSLSAGELGMSNCRRSPGVPRRSRQAFTGRDLFAPVAARLATGQAVSGEAAALIEWDWPDDLAEIVYVDHYGNAMTGIRASLLPAGTVIEIRNQHLGHARTFSDRSPGEAFWYENANGLLEIAVNGGSAAERFDLRPGATLKVLTPG